MAEGKSKEAKFHNPMHVSIAVVVVATICACMLQQGIEDKYVFGLLLAVMAVVFWTTGRIGHP